MSLVCAVPNLPFLTRSRSLWECAHELEQWIYLTAIVLSLVQARSPALPSCFKFPVFSRCCYTVFFFIQLRCFYAATMYFVLLRCVLFFHAVFFFLTFSPWYPSLPANIDPPPVRGAPAASPTKVPPTWSLSITPG